MRRSAAPSQELLVIRDNHKTGERSLDPIKWGLIPHRCDDPKGGRKPINAKAETIATLPMFGDAYARRRCIVPVDGFFERRAMMGEGEAALCHSHEGWLAFWSGWGLGELA
jgi:putative SOS response-associated peptidase YedK